MIARVGSRTAVIVGASLAGYRAAQSLRAQGHCGVIYLVGDEPHLPYDRPPLSKELLARTWDESHLWLASLLDLDRLGLRLIMGRSAVSLDIVARVVALDDGSDLFYDDLIIATGARPKLIAGLSEQSTLPSVHTMRTIEDTRALSKVLTQPRGERPRLTVVGSGFIGSEVASTGLKLGASVTSIDSRSAPMSAVNRPGFDAASFCSALLKLP